MDVPGLSRGPFSLSVQESATSHWIISVCSEKRMGGAGGGAVSVDQEGFRQSSGPHFLPQVLILCHIKELGLHFGHRDTFS